MVHCSRCLDFAVKRCEDLGDDRTCFGDIEEAADSALKDVDDLILSIATESIRLTNLKVEKC